MNSKIEETFAKAKRYQEFLNGNAYIPLQELSTYEKAYNKVKVGLVKD